MLCSVFVCISFHKVFRPGLLQQGYYKSQGYYRLFALLKCVTVNVSVIKYVINRLIVPPRDHTL